MDSSVKQQQEVITAWLFPTPVQALATSPDGRLLVTGCQDDRVRVHKCDAPPYELLCDTAGEMFSSVTALAVCGSGDNDDDDDVLVVTAHSWWKVRCWRVDVAARQLRLQWSGDGVREGKKSGFPCNAATVCISHDRKWVAVGGRNKNFLLDLEDYDICLFSLRAGVRESRRPIRVFARHRFTPHSLCFSPDDRLLVSVSEDETLRVWSVESGEQLQCVHVDSCVSRVAMRRCAELVTTHNDGSMRLWPLHGALVQRSLDRRDSRATSLRCTWDGRYAIAGEGTKIRIRNLVSGEQAAELKGHTGIVTGVGVTSSGNVVSGSSDGTVCLWRLESVDVRRAVAPVGALLAREYRAVQRVRERVVATSPLASVVLAIVMLNNEKMQRRIRK